LPRVDTGDALFAVEKLVLRDKRMEAGELLRHLKKIFDDRIRNMMRSGE
jgi:hypothetical protein